MLNTFSDVPIVLSQMPCQYLLILATVVSVTKTEEIRKRKPKITTSINRHISEVMVWVIHVVSPEGVRESTVYSGKDLWKTRISSGIWSRLYGLIGQTSCAAQKCESKFSKIFRRMILHKTPNHANICGNCWKDAGDIHNQKFVLPEKVDQSSPNFLEDAIPKSPHHVNFIEIGQTSLEKSVTKIGPQTQKKIFVTNRNVTTYVHLTACERRG